MANAKITDLPDIGTPAATDVIYVVGTPGGTPTDKKVQVQNLRGVKSFAVGARTSGDITLNATAITDVDTGLDLVVNAAVGDVIEYQIGALLSNISADVGFEVYTIVGGSPVNPFGPGISASLATLGGVTNWYCGANGAYTPVTGGTVRTLVSGDISSGTVTMRLRYAKTNTTARTLFADTNNPLRVWAKNLGH